MASGSPTTTYIMGCPLGTISSMDLSLQQTEREGGNEEDVVNSELVSPTVDLNVRDYCSCVSAYRLAAYP